MTDGYCNPKCYANALGDCSTIRSIEHYWSASIMSYIESVGNLSIGGIHWKTSDDPAIPLANWFGAKILCKAHNERLSGLDSEALEFLRHMQAINKHITEGTDIRPVRFTLSGDKLERWMLKALCGFLASGNARHGGERIRRSAPPLAWLQLLYGLERMPPGWGMYCRDRPRDFVRIEASLSFATLIDKTNYVQGCLLDLAGFRFLLAMHKPGKNIPGSLLEGASFHPSRFSFTSAATPRSATIDFSWESGPGKHTYHIQHKPM